MNSNKKYTWETDDDKEYWEHDIFNTVEECVQDYLENYADEEVQASIAIGEVDEYLIHVDGRSIIEDLEQQGYDECGECAESWEPFYGKSDEDWNELSLQLTKVVTDWLVKRNSMPGFYKIENIRKVDVR